MEITAKSVAKNNADLKKAAKENIHFNGKKISSEEFDKLSDEDKAKCAKGHVSCDIVQIHDAKKNGFSNNEVVHKEKFVDAAYALKHNENTLPQDDEISPAGSFKLYIINE